MTFLGDQVRNQYYSPLADVCSQTNVMWQSIVSMQLVVSHLMQEQSNSKRAAHDQQEL